MGQYTDKVEGHKPLSYQSSKTFNVSFSRPLQITIGIILTFIGSIGLIIILARKNKIQRSEEHKPISSTETE